MANTASPMASTHWGVLHRGVVFLWCLATGYPSLKMARGRSSARRVKEKYSH